MNKHYWSADDLRRLHEMSSSESVDAIARVLGRTKTAVRCKARSLGIPLQSNRPTAFYPPKRADGLPQSAIAARHNYDLERIRAEMGSSSSPDLQRRYQVGSETVRNWEGYYGQRVLRYCHSHKGYVPGDQIRRGTQSCIECPVEPAVIDHSGFGAGIHCAMPATPGRLSYWVQGGIDGAEGDDAPEGADGVDRGAGDELRAGGGVGADGQAGERDAEACGSEGAGHAHGAERLAGWETLPVGADQPGPAVAGA